MGEGGDTLGETMGEGETGGLTSYAVGESISSLLTLISARSPRPRDEESMCLSRDAPGASRIIDSSFVIDLENSIFLLYDPV